MTPDHVSVTKEILAELRAAVRASPLSQKALAQRVGITPGNMSLILAGKIKRSAAIRPLFVVLGLPLWHLYPLDDIELRWLSLLQRLRDQTTTDQTDYFTRRLRELVDREIAIARSRDDDE